MLGQFIFDFLLNHLTTWPPYKCSRHQPSHTIFFPLLQRPTLNAHIQTNAIQLTNWLMLPVRSPLVFALLAAPSTTQFALPGALHWLSAYAIRAQIHHDRAIARPKKQYDMCIQRLEIADCFAGREVICDLFELVVHTIYSYLELRYIPGCLANELTRFLTPNSISVKCARSASGIEQITMFNWATSDI